MAEDDEGPGDEVDPELKKLATTAKKAVDKIADEDQVDTPDTPRDGANRLEESRG